MRYDLDKLREDANAFDVAEAIGMQMYKAGSTWYVECVSGLHSETKINHNQLRKNGCHCYSCGKNYDVIGMVMAYYENVEKSPITFKEACGIVADTCGAREDYMVNARSGDYVPAKLLTEQELEALGLCKSRRIRVVTAFADEKYEFPEGERDRIEYVNDGYAYYSNASAININTLYREDKEAFKDLIQRKCVEQEAFYTTLIDTLTDRDEFGVLMRLYYKKLLNIIKDVKKRYLPQTVVFAVPEQTKAKKLFSL